MAKRIARTALDAPARTSTVYPGPFKPATEGRAKRALGNQFGIDQFGVNLTELAPGAATALRHWHSAEDEFVYVLRGSPTLITEAGEETLAPGDCVGFKAGIADGHCLVNRSDASVQVIEVGSRRLDDDHAEYPDLDMKVEPDGRGGRRFIHKDGTPYAED